MNERTTNRRGWMSLRLTVIGRDRLKSRLVNDCVERISADCMPELTIFTELVPVAVFLLLCLTYVLLEQ